MSLRGGAVAPNAFSVMPLTDEDLDYLVNGQDDDNSLLATRFSVRPDPSDKAEVLCAPPPDPLGNAMEADEGFGWLRTGADAVGHKTVFYPFDLRVYCREFAICFFYPLSALWMMPCARPGGCAALRARSYCTYRDSSKRVAAVLQEIMGICAVLCMFILVAWGASGALAGVGVDVSAVIILSAVRANAVGQKYARRDDWRHRRFGLDTLSSPQANAEQIILGWLRLPLDVAHWLVELECHVSGVDPLTPLVFAGTTVEEMKELLGPALTIAGQYIDGPAAVYHGSEHACAEDVPPQIVEVAPAPTPQSAGPGRSKDAGASVAAFAAAAVAHSTAEASATAVADAKALLSLPEDGRPPRKLGAVGEPLPDLAGLQRDATRARFRDAASRATARARSFSSSRHVLGTPANRHIPSGNGRTVAVPLYLYLIRLMIADSDHVSRHEIPLQERFLLYTTKQRVISCVSFGLINGLLPIVTRALVGQPALGPTPESAAVAVMAAVFNALISAGFVGPFTIACLTEYYRRAEWLRVVGLLIAPFDVSPHASFVPPFHRLRLHRGTLVNVANWGRLRRLVTAVGGAYKDRIDFFFAAFFALLGLVATYVAVPTALGLDANDPVTLAMAAFNGFFLCAVLGFMSRFGQSANNTAAAHTLFLNLQKEALTHSHALLDSKSVYVAGVPYAKRYYRNRHVGAQFCRLRDSMVWASADTAAAFDAHRVQAGHISAAARREAKPGSPARRPGSASSTAPGIAGADAAPAGGDEAAPEDRHFSETVLDVHLIADAKLRMALDDAARLVRAWDESNPVTFAGYRLDGRLTGLMLSIGGALFTLVWNRASGISAAEDG